MTSIKITYSEPGKEEEYSYDFINQGEFTIYQLNQPKKYLKSDFVRYTEFQFDEENKIKMCQKDGDKCKKKDTETDTKTENTKKSFKNKLKNKLKSFKIRPTDSLISRKLHKDNNIMNNFYLLGMLKGIIDKLPNTDNKSNQGNNQPIDINSIKFSKYYYTQKGGELMLIILAVIIIIVLLVMAYHCAMDAKCQGQSITILAWVSYMGGGGENNKGDKNNKLKQINKFKDKILNTNFFKIANQSNNEGKWYMYVEFSKDSLRRTYIKVPYIVYVETKDLESMDKFNKKYSIKLKNFIQSLYVSLESNENTGTGLKAKGKQMISKGKKAIYKKMLSDIEKKSEEMTKEYYRE